MKKRILITYDVEDWAYHKNAQILQKYLGEYYDIDIATDQDKHALINHINVVPYDLLFLQWFPDVDIFYKMFRLPYPVVTQVTSSVFFKMHKEGWDTLTQVPLVVSKSKQYFDSLKKIIGEEKTRLAYHVNDYNVFQPKTGRRNSEFTVGYVGRDCEIANENKGHTFIKEACDILGAEFKIAGFDERLPYDRMPEFYHSVDVVVCASRHEGAPNSMLESGLCGTPIVSTKVGQIQEMIQHGENGFFCERNSKSIAEKLRILRDDEELYNTFSENITVTCHKYAKLAITQWRDFFEEALNV